MFQCLCTASDFRFGIIPLNQPIQFLPGNHVVGGVVLFCWGKKVNDIFASAHFLKDGE